MIRDAYQSLLEWKQAASRKPLILQGARQVGKTWLMRDFGHREFKTTAYFNFESKRELATIFRQDLDTTRIIRSLEILHGSPINPEETLFIFDEIQECHEAITALKYFQENQPGMFIMAAGSLLSVAIHQGISFPVGKVTFMNLHPMGFHEFLRATGQDTLAQTLETGDLTLINPFADTLISRLKEYFFVGGMPEVVKVFADSHDLNKVRSLQQDIITAYENDFSKHAPPSQLPRIRMVWQSIPGQLAKENSKFIYSILRKGSRAKEFESALEWLKDAGLILKVNRITKPGIPLGTYAIWTDFKIYLHDTGLLGAMANLSPNAVLKGNELFTEFKGKLSEQFVLQLMVLKEKPGFYWNPENAKSEVDFIIQEKDSVIPIEVKSSENMKSRSLKVYYDTFKPGYCLRTSLAGYRDQGWVLNVPLYYFEQWLEDYDKIRPGKP